MTSVDFAPQVAPLKNNGLDLEEEEARKRQCRKEGEKKEKVARPEVREPVCLTVVATMLQSDLLGALLVTLLQFDLLEALLSILLQSDLLEALLLTLLQSDLLEALLATQVFGISRKCLRWLCPLHLGECIWLISPI